MQRTTARRKRMPKPISPNSKPPLQSDETQNVRVGIATDNRMNYQTDREDRQGTFNQYCIAIHEANIYTVLRVQPSRGQKDLSVVLKEVSLAH